MRNVQRSTSGRPRRRAAQVPRMRRVRLAAIVAVAALLIAAPWALLYVADRGGWLRAAVAVLILIFGLIFFEANRDR